MEGNLKMRDILRPIRWASPKGKMKQDCKKNYLGPKNDQNKFKNSGGSKSHKGGCYAYRKHGRFARDWKTKKYKNHANVVQVDDNIIAIVSKIIAIKGKICWVRIWTQRSL